MGHMQGQEMAGLVARGEVQRRAALEWHLTSNHYPGLPLALVPVAERAIELASAGEWDALVNMPAGIEFRGRDAASVADIIESMHLDDFIPSDGAEDLDDTGE